MSTHEVDNKDDYSKNTLQHTLMNAHHILSVDHTRGLFHPRKGTTNFIPMTSFLQLVAKPTPKHCICQRLGPNVKVKPYFDFDRKLATNVEPTKDDIDQMLTPCLAMLQAEFPRGIIAYASNHRWVTVNEVFKVSFHFFVNGYVTQSFQLRNTVHFWKSRPTQFPLAIHFDTMVYFAPNATLEQRKLFRFSNQVKPGTRNKPRLFVPSSSLTGSECHYIRVHNPSHLWMFCIVSPMLSQCPVVEAYESPYVVTNTSNMTQRSASALTDNNNDIDTNINPEPLDKLAKVTTMPTQVSPQPTEEQYTMMDRLLNQIATRKDFVEGYDPWLKVGMALHYWTSAAHHEESSQRGLALWSKFSQQGAKHTPCAAAQACNKKWKTFRSNGEQQRVQLGTLTYMHQEALKCMDYKQKASLHANSKEEQVTYAHLHIPRVHNLLENVTHIPNLVIRSTCKQYVNQFLNLEPMHQSKVTFISSPTGSGKTTFLKQARQSDLVKDCALVSIVSRVSLADFHATEFNLRHYNDDFVHTLLNEVIQVDSMLKVRDQAQALDPNEQPFVLFLDEANSLAFHLLNNLKNMNQSRILIVETLQILLQKARFVIACDADLSTGSIRFYQHLSQKHGMLYVNKCNTLRQEKVYLHPDLNSIRTELDRHIQQGVPFLCVSDRLKTFEKDIIIPLKHKYPNKEHDFKVYSSFEGDGEDFANLNDAWKSKFVFATPRIVYGLDYNTKASHSCFSVVYGGSLNALQISQQIARIRYPIAIHALVHKSKPCPRYSSLEQAVETLTSLFPTTNSQVNDMQQYSNAQSLSVNAFQVTAYHDIAQALKTLKACENYYQGIYGNDILFHLKALLMAKGFHQFVQLPPSPSKKQQIKSVTKEEWNAYKKLDFNLVMHAQDSRAHTYQVLHRRCQLLDQWWTPTSRNDQTLIQKYACDGQLFSTFLRWAQSFKATPNLTIANIDFPGLDKHVSLQSFKAQVKLVNALNNTLRLKWFQWNITEESKNEDLLSTSSLILKDAAGKQLQTFLNIVNKAFRINISKCKKAPSEFNLYLLLMKCLKSIYPTLFKAKRVSVYGKQLRCMQLNQNLLQEFEKIKLPELELRDCSMLVE